MNDFIKYLLVLLFLTHCGSVANSDVEEEESTTTASLASIQADIFTPKCASCHASGGTGYEQTQPSPLDLSSADASFEGLVGVASVQDRCGEENDEDCPTRVEAGDADNSYLVQKIENTNIGFATDRMPPNSTLDDDEIDLIRQWIEEGALEN